MTRDQLTNASIRFLALAIDGEDHGSAPFVDLLSKVGSEEEAMDVVRLLASVCASMAADVATAHGERFELEARAGLRDGQGNELPIQVILHARTDDGSVDRSRIVGLIS